MSEKKLKKLTPATAKQIRGGTHEICVDEDTGRTFPCPHGDEPKGPPGKPNAAWVREILNGNAADAAHDAVQRALG